MPRKHQGTPLADPASGAGDERDLAAQAIRQHTGSNGCRNVDYRVVMPDSPLGLMSHMVVTLYHFMVTTATIFEAMENPISRRSFLLTTGVVGSVAAVAPQGLASRASPGPAPAAAPLLNRERATELMRRVGMDALLVSAPMNVYYVTGATPVMSRFTQINMTAAFLPADLKRSIAYLGGGFEFYAGVADAGLNPGVEPYLTGGSLGDADSRSSPAFPRAGTYQFDAREQRRRALLEQAAP